MKTITKYLARYAEPETRIAQKQVKAIDNNTWQYCLVIPVYRESDAFFQRLAATLLQQQAVLLILVINQPDNLANAENSNTLLWQNLLGYTVEHHSKNNLHLRSVPTTNSNVLMIDRFSPTWQIPEKQGVGLARKIGADIALALIHSGHIINPWIYTSDGDAHLPIDYFSTLDPSVNFKTCTQPAAAIYPFKHICDGTSVGQATRLYEQRMHQYVDGLREAGSPYAFQTIGSAIAVSPKHYAQVRGFPKRSGGEDFYLLNKLAKTGLIHQLKQSTIYIEARQSDRVPFGTGPAINKLLTENTINEAKIFYNPRVFVALNTWLKAMANSQNTALKDLPLPIYILQALQAIGTDKAIDAARKVSTTTQTFNKHMNIWFDGFKTLKFIHYLRDNTYPNVCLKESQ